jgi:uncharacterized glyoxalase superfamily protein PhnB
MAVKINLGYRDAPAALNFLLNVLGFVPIVVYEGEHQGIIAHAEVSWPEGGVVTLHSIEEDNASVYDVADFAAKSAGYPPFSIHIDTDNPEEVYERVLGEGARIVRELTTTPRDRGFIVADPEGLFWSFATPLPKLVRDAAGEWVPE